MEENKKIIRDAFAELFMLMFENNTDNIELTFDFNKIMAKFKVELIDAKEKDENDR